MGNLALANTIYLLTVFFVTAEAPVEYNCILCNFNSVLALKYCLDLRYLDRYVLVITFLLVVVSEFIRVVLSRLTLVK